MIVIQADRENAACPICPQSSQTTVRQDLWYGDIRPAPLNSLLSNTH